MSPMSYFCRYPAHIPSWLKTLSDHITPLQRLKVTQLHPATRYARTALTLMSCPNGLSVVLVGAPARCMCATVLHIYTILHYRRGGLYRVTDNSVHVTQVADVIFRGTRNHTYHLGCSIRAPFMTRRRRLYGKRRNLYGNRHLEPIQRPRRTNMQLDVAELSRRKCS